MRHLRRHLSLGVAVAATLAILGCNGSSSQPSGPGRVTSCGHAECGEGQFCCNKSCGVCAPIGGSCTQQVCEGPQ